MRAPSAIKARAADHSRRFHTICTRIGRSSVVDLGYGFPAAAAMAAQVIIRNAIAVRFPHATSIAITSPEPHDLGMDDVQIRPAREDDAAGIADVYLASFAATYEFPRAHSDADTRRWIAEVLLASREVWVARAAAEGPIVAMMALTDEMVDQLYVAPGWTAHGIGSRLIGLAQSHRPNGLDLYTFQVNRGARRFYERHGFVEVASSDGSENEERQPDVRYAWRPATARSMR